MFGYPEVFNTKHDVYVAYDLDKAKTKEIIRTWLQEEYDWFFVKKLEDLESGIEDDTHKVVVHETNGERYQYELRKNESCMMYHLGFTRQEIENMLEG